MAELRDNKQFFGLNLGDGHSKSCNPAILPDDLAGWRDLAAVRLEVLKAEIPSQYLEVASTGENYRGPMFMKAVFLWITAIRSEQNLDPVAVSQPCDLTPLTSRISNDMSRGRDQERLWYWYLFNTLPKRYQERVDDGSVKGDPTNRILWLSFQYVRVLMGRPL